MSLKEILCKPLESLRGLYSANLELKREPLIWPHHKVAAEEIMEEWDEVLAYVDRSKNSLEEVNKVLQNYVSNTRREDPKLAYLLEKEFRARGLLLSE